MTSNRRGETKLLNRAGSSGRETRTMGARLTSEERETLTMRARLPFT
jgi:hypothetical protein